MFDLQNNYLDEDDTWAGKKSGTDFAVKFTYHTTLQYNWCLDVTSY